MTLVGWRVAVTKRKLVTPVKTDEGDTLTEEVSRIAFNATGMGIEPGGFQDFGLSVGLPNPPAGTKLTFKALQTYDGEGRALDRGRARAPGAGASGCDALVLVKC
ncbi:MAG: DUF1775 domain-containing protein [Solirubrobacteraceae bacterium]